jgi:hypothetical protein
MKIARSSRNQGGVLLIVLFTCLSIGIVLASFLALTSSRFKMAVRSTCWNQCIPVLEAGVEDALSHLHKDKMMTDNGWTPTTIGGQPVVVKKRTLPDGSYYNVTINSTITNSPYIYSQGFVPSPLSNNKYISRLVRVGATNPISIFSRAIATSGPITLSGQNVVVDSYDSAFGPYSTISNRMAHGGIATSSTAANAINIGSSHVYGTAETGPGGTITVGTGSIGDLGWSTGIEPGWSDNDMNVAFPSNTLPAGVLFPLTSFSGNQTITDTTNKINSANLGSGKNWTINGHVMLYCVGDFTISGSGYIQINPGAHLTLYVGGKTTKITGGGVANLTGMPSAFTYIGLAGNTDISIGGGGSFYGSVNAPQADVKVSGSGEMFGAVISKSYTASGNGSFHYDGELAKAGDLYVISWKEL